jgi:outer membrane protein with beta-barrel domain
VGVISKRTGLGFLLAAALAAPMAAQDWGVGVSLGLVNDVEDDFQLDEFRSEDVNAWVDFRLEEQVIVRGTFGSMKVKGENAGRLAGEPPTPLPDLETRIDYVTVSAAYQFWEGDYTSGLFAGIGGYRVNPDPAPSAITDFRDPREKVFGWHVGVDADFRVFSRLSIVTRITYHRVQSAFGRSILAANAGAVYRF